jgi:hypothetical protein
MRRALIRRVRLSGIPSEDNRSYLALGESYPFPLTGNAPVSCCSDPLAKRGRISRMARVKGFELGDFMVTKQSGTALKRLCSLLAAEAFYI